MTKYAIANGEEQGVGQLSTKELSRLAPDNPDQAFVLSDLGRPGFSNFLQELEYECYTPDSPANSLFEMFIITRRVCPFVVAAFPLKDLARARELAAQFDIRLEEGTIVMLGGDYPEPEAFPLGEHPNTFIAQGTCAKLRDLPNDEQRRIFLLREAELKRQYNVGQGPGTQN